MGDAMRLAVLHKGVKRRFSGYEGLSTQAEDWPVPISVLHWRGWTERQKDRQTDGQTDTTYLEPVAQVVATSGRCRPSPAS